MALAEVTLSPQPPAAETSALLRNEESFAFHVGSQVDAGLVRRKTNRSLLPYFFVFGLLCQLDRTNLAFAALQLDADLGFSKTVHGMGSGIFFLGYMTFQIPANTICIRIGARRWLAIIAACWSLVACSFSLIKNEVGFYIARFALGLAESGAYPGMFYHLTLFYDSREIGVAYTWTAMSTVAAGILGGPLAAGFLSLNGLLGLRGWQWLFIAEAIPTFVLAFVIWSALPERPSTAKFLSSEERSWLHDHMQKSGVPDLDASPHDALKDRRAWHLAVTYLLISIAMEGITFWTPQFVRAMLAGNISVKEVAQHRGGPPPSLHQTIVSSLLSSIPFTGAGIAMLANAYHAEKMNERRWHSAIPLVLSALALGFLPLGAKAGAVVALALLTMAASGIWSLHAPFYSWPSDFLSREAAAIAFALVKTLGSCGGFIGPFAIGAIADEEDFAVAILFLAVALVPAIFLILGFNPKAAADNLNVPKRSRSDIIERRPDY